MRMAPFAISRQARVEAYGLLAQVRGGPHVSSMRHGAPAAAGPAKSGLAPRRRRGRTMPAAHGVGLFSHSRGASRDTGHEKCAPSEHGSRARGRSTRRTPPGLPLHFHAINSGLGLRGSSTQMPSPAGHNSLGAGHGAKPSTSEARAARLPTPSSRHGQGGMLARDRNPGLAARPMVRARAEHQRPVFALAGHAASRRSCSWLDGTAGTAIRAGEQSDGTRAPGCPGRENARIVMMPLRMAERHPTVSTGTGARSGYTADESGHVQERQAAGLAAGVDRRFDSCAPMHKGSRHSLRERRGEQLVQALVS
jgi:hypothetical protein